MDAPPSQETTEFKKKKKPFIPACKKQKGELALLREQLEEQRKHSKEQMTLIALLKRQLALQEEQYKERVKE